MEREIMVFMEMYKNIKTSVLMDGERLDKFVVKVGVHQGLVLSPLLFAVVMDEITRDAREGGIKEILYADDLVLLGDDWTEVENVYSRWKSTIKEKERHESKCLQTKVFCTGAREVYSHSAKFPCSVRGKAVERNSIKCTKCENW